VLGRSRWRWGALGGRGGGGSGRDGSAIRQFSGFPGGDTHTPTPPISIGAAAQPPRHHSCGSRLCCLTLCNTAAAAGNSAARVLC